MKRSRLLLVVAFLFVCFGTRTALLSTDAINQLAGESKGGTSQRLR